MVAAVCVALVVLAAGLIARDRLRRHPPSIVESPATLPDVDAERITIEEIHGGQKRLVTHVKTNGVWQRETPQDSDPPRARKIYQSLSDYKTILLIAGLVIGFIGWAGMLIATVGAGIGWAIGYILLAPLVVPLFTLCHWDKARVWFFLQVAGSAVCVWATVLTLYTDGWHG